jgi:hypothetical protein
MREQESLLCILAGARPQTQGRGLCTDLRSAAPDRDF